VTFTVTALNRDGGYVIAVALQNVAVESKLGELEPIPDITYTDVSVGWLPG
jgi:hypothetical protein